MPTKTTLYKWLCDHCALLCDTEPDCHTHERVAHARHDLHLLRDVHARLQRHTNSDQLHEYEDICNQILSQIIQLKTTSEAEIQLHTQPTDTAEVLFNTPLESSTLARDLFEIIDIEEKDEKMDASRVETDDSNWVAEGSATKPGSTGFTCEHCATCASRTRYYCLQFLTCHFFIGILFNTPMHNRSTPDVQVPLPFGTTSFASAQGPQCV
jgi:hypothetical protein